MPKSFVEHDTKWTFNDASPIPTPLTGPFTVTVPNTAPTLTSISTLTGATEDTALTINYADLAAAADETDTDAGDTLRFRIEAVSTGTLTKGGAAVTAGTTTLGAGESLVWTPAANANGTLNAFTVKAYDGTDVSTTAVQVKVTTSAVNDAPTNKPTISGTATVGSELTSSTAAIADVDDLGTFGYQWQVSANGTDGWSNIETNSTSNKYTVTSGEAGKYIRVAVSYTDGGSTAETVCSDAFGPNRTSQAALVYDDVTKTYGAAKFTYTATGGSGGGAVSYASSDTSVATIDASTGEVTIKKFGTTTLTVTKAGDTTYTEASKSCTLTVDKAVLTATVGDYTKHYGEANPSFSVDVSGFVNGDTKDTAAGYTAPTASCSAADTTTDVSTKSITISGGVATNYTFVTTDTGTLTINPKALTYTIAADNREYNGTTSSTGTVTLVGVINSDTVTASGTFAFETAAVADGKTVNVTDVALSGADKDNYYCSLSAPTSTTANITKKSVAIASVTISDKVYDTTTGATISDVSLSGIIGTEGVSVDYSGATATFANASVGNGKTVTLGGTLVLAGTNKGNYILSATLPTITGNIVNAGTVLTPTASTAAGAIPPGSLVTLSCATADAEIRYTIDDSTPSSSSTLYTGAFTISGPVTIKAIAVKTGMNDSSLLELNYTMADTVTAHNSTELGTYISSTYVSTINLVSGTTYTYDGAAISRALTINGNGATVNVGTGVDGAVIKMTSGEVAAATGKVFLEVSGNLLTINNVTLQNGANPILCAINVKTSGSLYLDGVSFKGFFANSDVTTDTSANNCVNNFGVHAEPQATSTAVTNCSFNSSNALRNAVAIRGGTAAITNNTFVGANDDMAK
ncbi:MAG: YDG domain-containing protein, partial [Oscillospiraceae bacterium]